MKSLKAFLLIDFTDQMALAWACADGLDGGRTGRSVWWLGDLVRF